MFPTKPVWFSVKWLNLQCWSWLVWLVLYFKIVYDLFRLYFFILPFKDYVYEEIQERVQKPGSGNAATTIYDTVNFSSNPSASPHYSTINFLNSSDKADGEALISKPGSACEYSTVTFVQSPTNSPVNDPSTASLDPLYSTVNKPKKQKGNISPVGN